MPSKGEKRAKMVDYYKTIVLCIHCKILLWFFSILKKKRKKLVSLIDVLNVRFYTDYNNFVMMLPLKWEQIFTELVNSLITYSRPTGFFIKQRLQRREQDSGETERDSVVCESVRGSALRKWRDALVIKWAVRRNSLAK
jgi:hypothetical protein